MGVGPDGQPRCDKINRVLEGGFLLDGVMGPERCEPVLAFM